MFYQGCGCLHHLEVGLLEHNFFAGTLSAGLLAGLLRPTDNDALSERIEAVHQNAAETAAVCNEKSNGSNAQTMPSIVRKLRVMLRLRAVQASTMISNNIKIFHH